MRVKFAGCKTVCACIFFAGVSFGAFAYNPPVQGENFTGFINPFQIVSGASSAGGPLFTVTPSSVLANPALGAYQDRVSLDAGYTGIITGDSSHPYSQAFGTGVLIPTKWCNMSGELFGNFSLTDRMQFGNSFNLKSTVSKEVAENFSVGVGVGGGYLWGAGTDWTLTLDIGAMYRWGTLGPMNNFRIGASVLNIGKVYNRTNTAGLHRINGSDWTTYPGFMTLKVGAAAEFVNKPQFVLGLSLDVTTPFFQNVLIDAGVQMKIFKFITLSSGWQFNAQECAVGRQSWIPSVGLSFTFALDTSFIKKSGWAKSDMEAGAAWRNLYGNMNAISAGAVINLGQPDRTAPEIQINADFEE